MGRLLACVFFFAISLCATFSAAAGDRVALVIGNSDYAYVGRLTNPANDAADIGAELSRLGFRVTEVTDLDYNRIRLALRDFALAAQGADIAFVYYAGHGIEIDNTNYLIPVNAELRSDRDVDFEAIPLSLVLNAVEGAAGLKIVLIDACRNNPFLADMTRTSATRSIGRGLGRVEPGGVLVGYAARSGTVSQDGEGRNSPYAQALLRYLGEPGLEIGKLFRKVRDTVVATTDGAQEPFTYGSLPGEDLYIVPPVQTAALQTAPFTTVDGEIVAGFAAAESAGTLAKWNAFLDQYGAYPENQLVQLASERRDRLQTVADRKARAAARPPWLNLRLKPDGSADLSLEDRRLLQEALNYAGFDVGGTDGSFGPKTLTAISAARYKYGLQPGTKVDASLVRALPDAKAMAALKSEKARTYAVEDLPDSIEPRLLKALTYFAKTRRLLRFGYFKGHLYIAETDGFGSSFFTGGRIANEIGGHLATISSAEEDRFIYDLFSVDDVFLRHEDGYIFGPMFGLYQADRSQEPAGGWAWVTGEPLTYRHFASGNPDNHGGFQHYSRYFSGQGRLATYWDDTGESWGTFAAFIFEIE